MRLLVFPWRCISIEKNQRWPIRLPEWKEQTLTGMFPNWCSLKWVGRVAANLDYLCSSKDNDPNATKAKDENKQSACSYIAACPLHKVNYFLRRQTCPSKQGIQTDRPQHSSNRSRYKWHFPFCPLALITKPLSKLHYCINSFSFLALWTLVKDFSFSVNFEEAEAVNKKMEALFF